MWMISPICNRLFYYNDLVLKYVLKYDCLFDGQSLFKNIITGLHYTLLDNQTQVKCTSQK